MGWDDLLDAPAKRLEHENAMSQRDDDEESLPRLVKHAELPPRSWRSWLRRAGAESTTDGQMVEREGWSKHDEK